MSAAFSLTRGQWYAWQMLPGYGELPYFSPIFVHEIKPLKTGNGVMRVAFLNAGYAEGVQDFEANLKVLKRTERYLVADLGYNDRTAIISDISFPWIEKFYPHLWATSPPSRCSAAAQNSVSAYLDETLRRSAL